MKKIIILLLVFTFNKSFAQSSPDIIIGNWLKVPKEDFIIQVYKLNDKYQGKIIWTKSNNQKALIGSVILKNLKFNLKTKNWDEGKITDPNSGNTYSAAAKIKPDGLLEVNGYLGLSFFGIKKVFKRINNLQSY